MVHSGSRYLGIQVRDFYVAEGAVTSVLDGKLYSKIPHLQAQSALGQDYLEDIHTVCEFAKESRREMLIRALEIFKEIVSAMNIGTLIEDAVDVCHNYVEQEDFFGENLFVHRKGAIRLGKGETGFVPGSMGSFSYVVEGRGNEFGFCSSAHGGGRIMSRAKARRSISEEDFRESMKSIIYEHNSLLLDEAPAAYKDIRSVMRGQNDLVKIIHELRPIISVKGK